MTSKTRETGTAEAFRAFLDNPKPWLKAAGVLILATAAWLSLRFDLQSVRSVQSEQGRDIVSIKTYLIDGDKTHLVSRYGAD